MDDKRAEELKDFRAYCHAKLLEAMIRNTEYEIQKCDEILKMKAPKKPKEYIPSRKIKWCKFAMVFCGLGTIEAIVKSDIFDAILCVFMLFVAVAIFRSLRVSEAKKAQIHRASQEKYEKNLKNYHRKGDFALKQKELDRELKRLEREKENFKYSRYFRIPTELDNWQGFEMIDSYLASGRCNSVAEACTALMSELQIVKLNHQLKTLNDALAHIVSEPPQD